MNNPANKPPWPKPDASKLRSDPIFLFLLTPPFSGSTALSRVLNSGVRSMTLTHNAEGQWLLPGLSDPADRWDPNKDVDWDSVKAVWQQKIFSIERLCGQINVVIEKSPPNMMRAQGLATTFPRHQFVIFNRNPFAAVSSIFYRSHDVENLDDEQRLEVIGRRAKAWMDRASDLHQHSQSFDAVMFTYEEFCESPQAHVDRILERVPELVDVNVNVEFRVKDYAVGGLVNQNQKQVDRLSDSERAVISNELQKNRSLVEFFGYSCEWV